MAAYVLSDRLVRGIRCALALAGFICINFATAQAQPAPATAPPHAGVLADLAHRDTLLGDAGGIRPRLARHGITIDINDIEQWLGNVAGGFRQGVTYNAVTTASLQLDTEKAFGWQGGLLHVSGLQIRGRSLSQYYLGNLQTVSGISAEPSTRLWELWYQQSFFHHAFDIRLGQQSIDNEFMTSDGSALYLNTMMGWPMVPSADLYAGGPAYPLSSLGVRLRSRAGPVTVLAGVFDDNPPGGSFYNDNQLRGPTRWGDNASLRTGALFIAEMQYRLNQAKSDTGLPGTLQAGRVVRHRILPQSAVRHERCLAGQSRQQRDAGHDPTQLQLLWRRRPDDLATGPERTTRTLGVHPRDGRTGQPQPDRLQRQWRD